MISKIFKFRYKAKGVEVVTSVVAKTKNRAKKYFESFYSNEYEII